MTLPAALIEPLLRAWLAEDLGRGDLTAPALALRYTFARGVGLEASFSSENTLLGVDTGDGAWSVGVNFSF